MQVVGGWGDLCHYFLAEHLPPSTVKQADGYYHQNRRDFDSYFPAWQGDHWLSLITAEDTHTPVARFMLKPDGQVRIFLDTRDGERVETLQHKFPLTTDEPIAHLYWQIAEKYGDKLVKHLTKESQL